MTIITHPDQEARIHQGEQEGVMFPRGMHQCIAYCFAMEGVPAYEKSVHAKMIDMMRGDYIEHFDLSGVNMSGRTTLERRGECAKIRESIRRMLGDDETAYRVMCAKYAPDGLDSKISGMNTLCGVAIEKLNSGRYSAHRGGKYIADVVAHVCSPAQATKRCSVMAISRRHFVSHPTVSRDVGRVVRIVDEIMNSSISKVEEVFRVSGIVL